MRDYCTIVRAPQMDEALLQLLLRNNGSQHVLASAVIGSARRGTMPTSDGGARTILAMDEDERIFRKRPLLYLPKMEGAYRGRKRERK